jgi:hypothetical protein
LQFQLAWCSSRRSILATRCPIAHLPAEEEETFSKETLFLKRSLEEEEFNKASLQRKLAALEGERTARPRWSGRRLACRI